MRVKLLRHRRIGKKFHFRGEIIDVEDDLAIGLIDRGSAESLEVAPVLAVEDSQDGDGAFDDQDDLDDEVSGVQDNEAAEELPAADDSVPKPRKTDKLEVWQKYHRAQGKNPDGLTLADLKSYWAD